MVRVVSVVQLWLAELVVPRLREIEVMEQPSVVGGCKSMERC